MPPSLRPIDEAATAISEHRQTADPSRDAAGDSQSILDALPARLCVLDETGTILVTNHAWRRFAKAHAGAALEAHAGDNYLDICDAAADVPEAAAFARAIRTAIRDAPVEFSTEFAGHAPADPGWLLGRVTRVRGAGPVRVLLTYEDITARKRAELSVRRLASIVDSSDDAIIKRDLDSVITSWNRGAMQIFGYTASEMVGTSMLRLMPADRQGEEPHLLGRLQRRERVEAFETQRQTKDGRLIHVSVTASPITAASGQVIGASTIVRDISDRAHAEEARRVMEDRYRALFEYAPDGIVMADRASHLLDVNASLCRMLGYTRDELIGRPASTIVVPSEIPYIDSALRIIAATSHHHREWRLLRKDGSSCQADVIATVMPDGHLLAIIRDVSDWRDAEERMRFALQNAEVGIWDMDFATGVVRWSEMLESQYGLPPRSFGGTFAAFVNCVHPDDRASVISGFEQARTSGGDFSIVNRSTRPGESERWLSGKGRVLLGVDGEPVRAVGISLDVTERRTLEAQYLQAQKMEAIGRLAGGVAHDFNNLLTAILGYCDLLLTDVDPTDRRSADIRAIQTAGTRAAGLTRQLLTFSRKQIIEPTRLDLNVVVTDVQDLLGRLIGEDVDIVLQLGAEWAAVLADRGQVEQIVMNLAINARDAMPTGGTLTIDTANVDLDQDDATPHFAVKPGPYVALTVADTGTGMTPAVQARLFEPFYTTKEVGKGTGLGLATIHGIVTQSGGSVRVVSEVGTGTAFTIYLPQAEPAGLVVHTPTIVARGPGGSETVLVVEDAEGLRELTQRLLQRQGYTVLVASSASDALRVCEQHPSIDVILTDVVMPGASGPALTSQLMDRRPLLKVIYMSGYTEETIVHHGVLKPGIAFLHKPFTAETLGRKIRDVLDR